MEIATVGQCVLELILNALDAKTTGVAVRFHSEEKKIQVIDSGEGIPPDVLVRIGENEKKNGSSSRVTCYSHTEKGESLKQIIELSETCIITSKHNGSPTYEKVFQIGESPVFLRKNWLDKGTIVTIYGFQGSGWDSASNAIYFGITSLALIYTDVSFTFQDQKADKLVVAISKPHEPYSILNIICRQAISLKTSWHLNSGNSSDFKICGYIGYLETKTSFIRNIFVNRRPVNCLQIQKLINETMKDLSDELKISSIDNIYFVLFIQCPPSDFILSSYEGRTFVIFEQWTTFSEIVKTCLVNTIQVNCNNFMEPGSSSFPESFNRYQSYENKENYLEERNNHVVQKLDEKCLKVSNQPLKKKVSTAVQTSVVPKDQKFKKQLKGKIFKKKPTIKFSHNKQNCNEFEVGKTLAKKIAYSRAKKKKKALLKLLNNEETSETPLKAKPKKLKPLSVPKKNLKDIYERKMSKSSELNKEETVENVEKDETPEKDQKEIKKSLVDKKLKLRKNPISKRNENMIKRPLGSHKIIMTQLSFLQKNRRDKLREQRKKREAERKFDIPKENHDIVEQYLKKQENVRVSNEIRPKEKIKSKVEQFDIPRKNHLNHDIIEQYLKKQENDRLSNEIRPKEKVKSKVEQQFDISRKNHLPNYDIVEQYLKDQENVRLSNEIRLKEKMKSKVEQQFDIPRKNHLPNHDIIEQYLKKQNVKIPNFEILPKEKMKLEQQFAIPRRNHNDFVEQFFKNQRKVEMSNFEILPEKKVIKKMKTELGQRITVPRRNHDDVIKQFLKNQNKVKEVPDFSFFAEKRFSQNVTFDFEPRIANVKGNIEEIVKKIWRNEKEKEKNHKMWPEEKMIDADKIRKLNDYQTVIKRLQKHRKYYLDEIDLLNKDVLKQRDTRMPQLERMHRNQQELHKKEERKHFYETEKYNLIERALHQRQEEKLNQFKRPDDKVMKIFEENKKFLLDRRNSQIEETRNENLADSRQEIVNQFVTEHCSQLSEWSDWNYVLPIPENNVQVPESKKVDECRLYYFLPSIFNSMLCFAKNHILSEANIQNDVENVSTIFRPKIKSDQITSRYQNLNVRHCVDPHPNEFKLNRKSLYSIEILRQVNSEFIAALAVQDNSRLLLLIDQHAADERIRYENLLQRYRIDRTKQYYSMVLDHPILITDMESHKIKLLLSNQKLLYKFGVQLKINSFSTLIVTNVPRCFLRRKSEYNEFKLFSSVKNLLLEIVESLESTNGASILPKSIHNAIASEACRGAIKFGDLLTNDQCCSLIKSLRKAKAPNRCAHGRPAIVPLLDVTDLKKKQKKPFQKKLNFASLMKKEKIKCSFLDGKEKKLNFKSLMRR